MFPTPTSLEHPTKRCPTLGVPQSQQKYYYLMASKSRSARISGKPCTIFARKAPALGSGLRQFDSGGPFASLAHEYPFFSHSLSGFRLFLNAGQRTAPLRQALASSLLEWQNRKFPNIKMGVQDTSSHLPRHSLSFHSSASLYPPSARKTKK